MAFGFGIGDFIAAGDLCWTIYREVYKVARDAPTEVKSLNKELSDMSNAIKALVEDVDNPDSSIAQAGQDRVQLTNDIMKGTKDVLDSLQGLLKKYDLLSSTRKADNKKASVKQYWSRFKYAKEVRTINDLRAKLGYQNGLLTLLLLSANNSSLERVRSQNEKLLTSVEEIKGFIYGPRHKSEVPMIGGQTDQQFQFELTRDMMAMAELNGRPWSSIGIDNWIQAGKWWLMKAQAHLYSTKSDVKEICQSYTNLLKASWILTDVIAAHPQINFGSNSSQLIDIQHLGNAIKAEHKRVASHLQVKPRPQEIMKADLSIWYPTSTTVLMPNLHGTQGQQPLLWKTSSGEVVYQRFGSYLSRLTALRIECMIVLEAKFDDKELYLIGQTFDGQNLFRYNILELEVPCNLSMTSDLSDTESGTMNFLPAQKTLKKRDRETLIFLEFEDARQLNLLLRHITKFRLDFPAAPFAIRTLWGGALFEYLRVLHEEGKQIVESHVDRDIQLLSDRTGDLGLQDFSCLWNLAMYASTLPGRPPCFKDLQRHHGVPISLLSVAFWASPTAQCCLATLDCVAPKGSDYYEPYSEELIQAAIYQENKTLLVSEFECLEVPPEDVRKTDFEKLTDTFVKILFQYRRSINELAGPYILLWASLKKKNIGLFDVMMDLSRGEIPGFARVLEEIIENKDVDACHVMLNRTTPVGLCWGPSERLVLRAIALRFPEGLKCVLSFYGDEPYPGWTIPALLTFNTEIVHCLKEHDYLSSNVDPVYHGVKDWDYQSRIGDFQVLDPSSDITIVPGLHWYMTQGSPHLPLYIAVHLGCDPSIIIDLVSAGALVMRKTFSAKTRPQVIEHVQNCNTVGSARNVFYQTVFRMQNLFASYREMHRKMKMDFTDGVDTTSVATAFLGDVFSKYRGIRESKAVEAVEAAEIVMAIFFARPKQESIQHHVVLPKSLETEENWTRWREKVLPILQQAHVCQFGEQSVETAEAVDSDKEDVQDTLFSLRTNS